MKIKRPVFSTGGEGDLCPACRKGVLHVEPWLKTLPLYFDCANCGSVFYKNAIGELINQGTRENMQEYKDWLEKNKDSIRKLITPR